MTARLNRHPLFDELELALAPFVPQEPVLLAGAWTRSIRRSYANAAQLGTGSGPFVDVVDLRWGGSLSCAVPVAALSFLATARELFWAKSAPPAAVQPVHISLHAYERDRSGAATFAAGVADSFLPGVPTSGAHDLAAVPMPGPARFTTGRVTQLAATTEVSFHVLVLQRPIVTVGRKRLWRVRDELASALPPRACELLTRRRSGTLGMSE